MRIALALLLLLVRVADPKIQVASDVESGVYEAGKTVTWNIEVKDGDAPGAGKISYVVKNGGLGEASKGDVELKEGKAQITGTRTTPGVLLLEVKYGKAVAHGGAAFDPDKVAASSPPPDDFDKFWKEKV